MNTDNITSKGITLNENGKLMQIEIYEKQIQELTNNWNELEEWARTLIEHNNQRYELYKDDKLHYEYEISNIKYQNNMLMAFLDKMKEISGRNDKD